MKLDSQHALPREHEVGGSVNMTTHTRKIDGKTIFPQRASSKYHTPQMYAHHVCKSASGSGRRNHPNIQSAKGQKTKTENGISFV